MTIAITGAAGNLGRHITSALDRTGHDYRVIARREPVGRVDQEHVVVAGGYDDPDGLTEAMRGVDHGLGRRTAGSVQSLVLRPHGPIRHEIYTATQVIAASEVGLSRRGLGIAQARRHSRPPMATVRLSGWNRRTADFVRSRNGEFRRSSNGSGEPGPEGPGRPRLDRLSAPAPGRYGR